MSFDWTFKKATVESDKFEINDLNIWDFKWQDTGEKIIIKDPQYGQSHTFTVYEINNGNAKAIFAAGEFSNGIWGIYQKE